MLGSRHFVGQIGKFSERNDKCDFLVRIGFDLTVSFCVHKLQVQGFHLSLNNVSSIFWKSIGILIGCATLFINSFM